MKILVFSPYAINNPHYETELEIIQKHLDQGDQVVMLACNNHLWSCDVNLTHQLNTCLQCISRRVKGLDLLSEEITVKPLYYLTADQQQEINNLPKNWQNIEQLKNFTIENFDIGYGVLSSLVSYLRDPQPDLAKYQEIIYRLLKTSLAVYRSIQNYLQTTEFQRVYIYNGRYAPMRAAFRASQSCQIDCFLHERGHALDYYMIYENALPHDLTYIQKLMYKSWSEATTNIDQRQEIASQFYLDRTQGISHNWVAFTKEQTDGLLPQNWQPDLNNIVIFTSSEDEFVAIGDLWQNPLYNNQLEGLATIINSVADDQNMHIYVRIHPNLKNVQNSQSEILKTWRSPHVTIIPPDSPISSYSLLKNANKIITFGSTIGIEAVYWGVPSILAGQSFYRALGGTYQPNSHEQLIEMLYSDLPPQEKEPALIYGYFFQTFGLPFQYFQATGLFTGNFRGVNIEGNAMELITQIGITKDMSKLTTNPQKFTTKFTTILEQVTNLLNHQKNQEVLELLDKLIDNSPVSAGLYYARAIALSRLGKIKEAIDSLQQLLTIIPGHQKAQILLQELSLDMVKFSR